MTTKKVQIFLLGVFLLIGVAIVALLLWPRPEKEEVSEGALPEVEVSPTPIPHINSSILPPEPGPKFIIGEKVVTTTDNLAVRSESRIDSSTWIKEYPKGTQGTVLEGPTEEIDGYIWWKIKYEDGITGWSAEKYLELEELEIRRLDPVKCRFGRLFPAGMIKRTDRYGIFGDDVFDTFVCGYLRIREEIVWGKKQKNAYFVIVDFEDEGFIKSLAEGIRRGNTVNKKIDGNYWLNLGCFEEGRIIGKEWEEPYLDEETQTKLLNSSPENLLSLVLSFGLHPGSGCDCCNLAHKIRAY